MSRNDEYTTGNLLEYLYNQKCYKFINIDLSEQANTTILLQVNFTGKLEEGNGTISFLLKSSKKKIKFSLDSLNVTK